MSEEFQGGVCGGSWCINPSTNLFRSSPCASAINGPGSFGWLSHDQPTIYPNTARSGSDDSAGSTGSIVLVDHDDNWNQNLMDGSNIQKQGQDYSDHMLLQQNYSSTMDDNNYGQNSFSFMNSSPSYGYNNSSSLFQTFFDADSQPDHPHQQHQQPSLDQSTNYSPCPEYYLSPAGFRPSMVNKIDSKPASNNNHLQFTNNTTFWNATTPNFVPSSQPQSVLRSKPNLHGLKTKRNNQELKKGGNESSSKRSRAETPSPLPTFKVRKEKLGDRITALQQLVSPFGKTDTASVLHESIEYIKFLHDQVSVLTTPYLKNGSSHVLHQQAGEKTSKNETAETHDLKSRGLCLVPISSTFPVAAETTADFWTPTFGGCFRNRNSC